MRAARHESIDFPQPANVVVGTDPRTPKALMDGKANDKSLKKYLESVQGAVDGSRLPR